MAAEPVPGERGHAPTLRTRLTRWYAGVLVLLLAASAVLSLVLVRRVLVAGTDRYLDEVVFSFIAELRGERGEIATLDGAVATALAEFRLRDAGLVVLRRRGDGAALVAAAAPARAAPSPLPASDDPRWLGPILAARAAGHVVKVTIPDHGGARVIATSLVLGADTVIVAVAQPLREQRAALAELGLAMLAGFPVLLALAVAGGRLVAARALAPLAAMSVRAADIGAANLHDRLPVANPHDELGRLAVVVNGLLARLESALAQQRQFMADASHELRTPVAIVRNEAEIALARERSAAALRDALVVVRAESVRLTRLVDDLFLLARADAGQQPLYPVELWLDELAEDVALAARTIAERRGVRIETEVEDELRCRGDTALLRRLLLNLVDNAIKHSPRGGVVRLAAARVPAGCRVTVHDEGRGVPAEARARIFDRFYRADAARSRDGDDADGGAGLGLAIAKWIAERHGGALRLTRAGPGEGGTEFELLLPAATAPAGRAVVEPSAAATPG